MHADPYGPLELELERAALLEVGFTWDNLNRTHFRSRMTRPAFEMTSDQSYLARWLSESRTIQFAWGTLLRHGWGGVVELLKHEMAHQYVDEVLGVHDETSHGTAFRKVCEERAIDARASGAPENADADGGARERARVLERVAKLLALAQSPNLHEAESAMNAAQRLMLKHNIEASNDAVKRGYCFRHIGEPTSRIDETRRALSVLLHKHFFVETIWVQVWDAKTLRRASVLEVCGTRDNVEMAEYVYSFLKHTAEGLWRQHKKANGIRGDRDRRAYVAGVLSGFREKLDTQRGEDAGKGLVWVGDADLDGYFKKRHPSVRTFYGTSSARSTAHAHGRAAGRSIVLHKGVSAGSSSGGGVKQLGPGRKH